MDALTEQLMKQLSGKGLTKISRQIGADKQTTKSALSTAVPLLISALAQNASAPDGAQSLHQALAKDHDGSILDNLSGFLQNPESGNGAGILGHILGNQQPAVTQGLAQKAGLESGQIGQLLQTVAPLLMGLLGRQQQQTGLDASSLTTFLGGQQQQAQQSNPDLMSGLNALLGGNNQSQGGSPLDGVMDMVGKLMGGKG